MQLVGLTRAATASVVSVTVVLGFLAGCSDADSESFEDQLAEYNSISSDRISSFAEMIAPAYTEFLLSADTAQSGIRTFEEQKTKALESLRDDVCAELAKVAKAAGSGAERASRLDRVKEGSDMLLQNEVAFEILRSALEHPQHERDLLLERLAIKSTAGGAESQGMDALKALGLVSPDGHFLEPTPGTATYTSFESWLDGTLGLRGAVVNISRGRLLCAVA